MGRGVYLCQIIPRETPKLSTGAGEAEYSPTPVARRRSTLSGQCRPLQKRGRSGMHPSGQASAAPQQRQGQGHCRRGRGIPADAKLDGPLPIRRRRLSRQERRGSASVLRQQLCVPLEALVAVGQMFRASSRRSSSSRPSPDKGGQAASVKCPSGRKHVIVPTPSMPPEASACPGQLCMDGSPAGPAPGAASSGVFPPAGTAGTPADRALACEGSGPGFQPTLCRTVLRRGRQPRRDIVLSRQQGVALIGALVSLGLGPRGTATAAHSREGWRPGGGRRRGRSPASDPRPRRLSRTSWKQTV